MEEPTDKEEPQTVPPFSLRSFLKLKSIWLIAIGTFMTVISSSLVWVTASVSVPFINFFYFLTITGYDATWNLALGSPTMFRMIYFQLASIALALIALFLKSVFTSETPKWVRSMMLIVSGILGLTVPAYFIYVSMSQAQQLSSQFQWLLDLLKTYIQMQYNFSVGPGLILAIVGPILLLISSVFVFREKI